MRMSAKPRLALIVGLAVLAAVFSTTASATPPEHVQFSEQDTFVYQPCGLTETATVDFSVTFFFDQEGNDLRAIAQVAFDGLITDPSTGETFRDVGHQTLEVFPQGGGTLSGIFFNIRQPGEGVIFLSVGRLVFDAEGNTVFSSAKAFGFDTTDAALCEALT
jgi:hypothetical protein